jgi:hypothetical protein
VLRCGVSTRLMTASGQSLLGRGWRQLSPCRHTPESGSETLACGAVSQFKPETLPSSPGSPPCQTGVGFSRCHAGRSTLHPERDARATTSRSWKRRGEPISSSPLYASGPVQQSPGFFLALPPAPAAIVPATAEDEDDQDDDQKRGAIHVCPPWTPRCAKELYAQP